MALIAALVASPAAGANGDGPPGRRDVSRTVAAQAAYAAAHRDLPDVVYRTVNGTELRLDLVLPAATAMPAPAVIVFHGGAWREGSRKEVHDILESLASHGIAGVAPQYRFCPEHPFPAQVHDAKAAVRWVRLHAAEYGIDPARLGAMGFSAGAHLALMLGLTGPADGLEGDVEEGAPSSAVSAVVNFFGPVNLLAADTPDRSKPLLSACLGGDIVERNELATQLSPLTWIGAGDPPILSFHGVSDPLVPATQALDLMKVQNAASVPGRVEFLLGGGHGGWPQADTDRTLDEAYAFFAEQLGAKP